MPAYKDVPTVDIGHLCLIPIPPSYLLNCSKDTSYDQDPLSPPHHSQRTSM